MKKILLLGFIVLAFFILNLFANPLFVSTAYAVITVEQNPNPVCQDSKEYTMIFNGAEDEFIKNEEYTLRIWKYKEGSNDLNNANSYRYPYESADGKILTQVRNPTTRETAVTIRNQTEEIGRWHYKLWFGKEFDTFKKEPNKVIASGNYTMYPKETCNLGLPVLEMSSPVRVTDTVLIKIKNINPDSKYLLWFIDGQVFNSGKFDTEIIIDEKFTDKSGIEENIKTAYFSVKLNDQSGDKTLCLKHGSINWFGFGKDGCEISIPIKVTAEKLQVTPVIIKSGEVGAPLDASTLFSEPPPADLPNIPPPCAEYEGEKCIAVNTAIGPISTNPAEFVQKIFSIVLGLAGGIALILIMLAGYKMMASQGNPEAVQAARDQLISAIVGLLFIIFSFVILQVIGVDILKIPGFKP